VHFVTGPSKRSAKKRRDVHIRFHLDQQFTALLNEKNIARQYGDLVLERYARGE